jgi:transposase
MTGKQGSSPESIVREIKRQTRRKFTAEEKIRIVLEGLRGEAGKRQLNGDTIREVGSDEVKEIRLENDSLKMVVAELTLRNRTLKKPCRV